MRRHQSKKPGRIARRLRTPLLAVAMATTLATAGCSGPVNAYGGPPTWLPTPTPSSDTPLAGSHGHPALAIQGETVRAQMPGGGTVLITVTGPAVPGTGTGSATPGGSTVAATWEVALNEGTVDVPIADEDFAVLDAAGGVHRPSLVPDQPTLHLILSPGQSMTVEVTIMVPPGEGLFQWAPDGHTLIASWDYTLELS
ncbi:MAG: hypothetical protein FWD75_11165 [Propionibacteriaceae bacterium]|nr:hypothetical protein [Propionibacteriaceae bacterium]